MLELGPAFDNRHPEQGNEPALGVVHHHMVSLDLGTAGYYGLRTDSWVFEPHNVRFVARLHLPGYLIRVHFLQGNERLGRPHSARQI